MSVDHFRHNERARARAIELQDMAIASLQLAYRKHHMGDESIGWNELGDDLASTLQEIMGDKEFQAWSEEVDRQQRSQENRAKLARIYGHLGTEEEPTP